MQSNLSSSCQIMHFLGSLLIVTLGIDKENGVLYIYAFGKWLIHLGATLYVESVFCKRYLYKKQRKQYEGHNTPQAIILTVGLRSV